MNYENADRAIMDMNRRNLRAFGKLRLMKFDELNVLRRVSNTYDDSARYAKKRYREIAYEAYIAALVLAGIAQARAKGMAKKDITADWVLDMLEEYDPVTLYRFTPETERKKQRTVEAILAAQNKNEVIDRSLRLWTRQTSHYADESVDRATVEGYRTAGIRKVKWVTQEDEKVCEECNERDGVIYAIDEIPPKPHYNCRCYVVPATEGEK